MQNNKIQGINETLIRPNILFIIMLILKVYALLNHFYFVISVFVNRL